MQSIKLDRHDNTQTKQSSLDEGKNLKNPAKSLAARADNRSHDPFGVGSGRDMVAQKQDLGSSPSRKF